MCILGKQKAFGPCKYYYAAEFCSFHVSYLQNEGQAGSTHSALEVTADSRDSGPWEHRTATYACTVVVCRCIKAH